MKIAIGSDHAGFELKEHIKQFLETRDISIKDVGVYSLDRADYPDLAVKVARAVSTKDCDKGILICGSGIGVSIAANKIKGIRAALCHDAYCAKMAREHNDANIVALGARVIGPGQAEMIVDTFLNTKFAKGRHAARVEKIMNIENIDDNKY